MQPLSQARATMAYLVVSRRDDSAAHFVRGRANSVGQVPCIQDDRVYYIKFQLKLVYKWEMQMSYLVVII